MTVRLGKKLGTMIKEESCRISKKRKVQVFSCKKQREKNHKNNTSKIVTQLSQSRLSHSHSSNLMIQSTNNTSGPYPEPVTSPILLPHPTNQPTNLHYTCAPFPITHTPPFTTSLQNYQTM